MIRTRTDSQLFVRRYSLWHGHAPTVTEATETISPIMKSMVRKMKVASRSNRICVENHRYSPPPPFLLNPLPLTRPLILRKGSGSFFFSQRDRPVLDFKPPTSYSFSSSSTRHFSASSSFSSSSSSLSSSSSISSKLPFLFAPLGPRPLENSS